MTFGRQECVSQRKALGMSVERLAHLAGVTERTVVRFESGAAAPRPGTIIALRKALKMAAQRAHLQD